MSGCTVLGRSAVKGHYICMYSDYYTRWCSDVWCGIQQHGHVRCASYVAMAFRACDSFTAVYLHSCRLMYLDTWHVTQWAGRPAAVCDTVLLAAAAAGYPGQHGTKVTCDR
jgi:hypothetical protein